MLKNISQLLAKIEDKEVRLLTDMDTDVRIVEQALVLFQNFVDQIKKAAAASQAQQEPKVEEDVKQH